MLQAGGSRWIVVRRKRRRLVLLVEFQSSSEIEVNVGQDEDSEIGEDHNLNSGKTKNHLVRNKSTAQQRCAPAQFDS